MMRRNLCLSALFLLAHAASSQCSWPDSVSRRYELTAWKAVYEKGYTNGETAITRNLFLPVDSMKLVLGLMGCIYNDTGSARDSIFLFGAFERIVYRQYESDIYSVPFTAAPGTGYADSWLFKRSSGIKALEDIVKNDSFSIWCNFINRYHGRVYHQKGLNTALLADSLNKASGSSDFYPYSTYGDGNFIRWRRNKDTILLTFSFRWGDCLSGCAYFKYLTYKFYNGHKYGPFYEDNIPDLPKGPHYFTSGVRIKSRWVCDTAFHPYSAYIPWPYNYYTGKGWGKWLVNGKDQTEYMLKNRQLLLTGAGTFYIAHVPNDSSGVWYRDTFTINKYSYPGKSIFAVTDTILLCGRLWSGQSYEEEYMPYLAGWLQDSLRQKSWAISFRSLDPKNDVTIELNPGEKINSVRVVVYSKLFSCALTDTMFYKARFYPVYFQREMEQKCLHTAQRVNTTYPVRDVMCPWPSGDSSCAFYGPSNNYMTYHYQGCYVREDIKVRASKARRVGTSASFRVAGADSVLIDAGAGWKTVFWNRQPGSRYYTFRGRNISRIDTIHLRCVDSGDCYDTLLITVTQDMLSGVKRPKGSVTKIYPNPATDKLVVETGLNVKWAVLSLQGQLILQGTGPMTIDLSSCAQGVYLFRAEGETAQMFEVLR